MSTVITASGAIPLLSTSSAAVNSAANYRQGFIGAFAAPAASGPMAWLSGVISTTSTGNTYSVDLLPIPLGTPGQGVQVWPGTAVIFRGASNGPYLVNFNNTATITLDAADATNPRIDVVYAYVNDTAIGDGGTTNGGFMAVQNGVASSTPAVPAIPSGAIALAQVYRNTVSGGGNTITSANITDVRLSAGTSGGVRLYLPGDTLSASGSHNGEVTFDSATYKIRYWNAGTWHGVLNQYLSGSWANGTSNIQLSTISAAPTTIMTVSVPDPGFPYYVVPSAQIETTNWGTFTAGLAPYGDFSLTLDSNTGTKINGGRIWVQDTSNSHAVSGAIAPNISSALTGNHTVYLSGVGSVAGWCNYSPVTTKTTYLTVQIVPA